MLYMNYFDYDFSFLFFTETFCYQNKFNDLSFDSIVKENILSQLYTFNLFKYNSKEEEFQCVLVKNDFFIKLGDKISFIIGLVNLKKIKLKFIKNFNYYLSTLVIAKRNIPFDLKIILTSYNAYKKEFILEKNSTNNIWLNNEIPTILFFIKRFKNSAENIFDFLNFKIDKNVSSLVNKKLLVEWLQNLKNNDFWNKIKVLDLKFNRNKKYYCLNKLLSFKKNKDSTPENFLTMRKQFRKNILLSIHRHQLFMICKKLVFLEKIIYFGNRKINFSSKIIKILKISNYMCKELSNTYRMSLYNKNLIYLLESSYSNDLFRINMLMQIIKNSLIKF